MSTPDTATVRYHPGPWGVVKAVIARCSDNRKRWARAGYPESFSSTPARVSVGGRTVSGFVTLDGEHMVFHASRTGRNGHLLPADHAPQQYWRAMWRAHTARNFALLYCGPIDFHRSHGIRTAASEGRSMMEHVRPHALAHMAWRNVATLARVHATRYGWDLADCDARRQTPRPVCEVQP